MNFERSPRKTGQVGLIPLIDVAMFLLIFFMVAGTVEKFEVLPINPPVAANSKLVDEGHIVILMGTREELVMGEDLVTPEELEARVREQIKANPAKIITLKADASIQAVRVIDVMERLKKAGAANLSVATQVLP